MGNREQAALNETAKLLNCIVFRDFLSKFTDFYVEYNYSRLLPFFSRKYMLFNRVDKSTVRFTLASDEKHEVSVETTSTCPKVKEAVSGFRLALEKSIENVNNQVLLDTIANDSTDNEGIPY